MSAISLLRLKILFSFKSVLKVWFSGNLECVSGFYKGLKYCIISYLF